MKKVSEKDEGRRDNLKGTYSFEEHTEREMSENTKGKKVRRNRAKEGKERKGKGKISTRKYMSKQQGRKKKMEEGRNVEKGRKGEEGRGGGGEDKEEWGCGAQNEMKYT